MLFRRSLSVSLRKPYSCHLFALHQTLRDTPQAPPDTELCSDFLHMWPAQCLSSFQSFCLSLFLHYGNPTVCVVSECNGHFVSKVVRHLPLHCELQAAGPLRLKYLTCDGAPVLPL